MRIIIVAIIFSIFLLCSVPLVILCFLLQWRAPIYFLGKKALNLARLILGIEVEIVGRQTQDLKKAHIYMANHLSLLDGPILVWLITQPVRVLLKQEVFRFPILGQIMRFAGFVPVDRKGLKSGKKSIDKAIQLIKHKGYSYLIFPEGTRSKDGKIQAFRRGGFFLAINSRASIVPISISGSFELMPKGSLAVKKGKIRIIFHPEISVLGMDTNSLPLLMEKVRDAVVSGLRMPNSETLFSEPPMPEGV
jgi:1-acyl-sn-glycerol-3-phosphate acyltransferase